MTHRSKKKKNELEEVADEIRKKAPREVEHNNYNGNKDTALHRTLEIRTTPIVIGLPLDELMFSQFFTNLVCLSIMPWDSFLSVTNTLVDEARNMIHDRFLEKSTAPFLLMLDSDVLPPPDTIERLMKHNLPVVAGWYRKKEKFRYKDVSGAEVVIQRPCVYDYQSFNEQTDKFEFVARLQPGQGLEKVDGIGAGCILLRRDAAEKVGKSPFTFKNGGEDLTFCRRLNGAGFDVYVDWSVACAHAGVFWV